MLDVARHQHAHEVLGVMVGVIAGDDDLLDVLVIEVADRTLDEVAFLVDEVGGTRRQGEVADAFPQPEQIFEVALDLLLGASGARRADDQAHALRHLELVGDGLQALAVLGVGDLARNAAAARRVRHQHGIASGKRQVGRERGALVAAFFFDHLHQDHLAAFDDFLDFVAAAVPARTRGQFLERVFGARLLDRFCFAAGSGGGFGHHLDAAVAVAVLVCGFSGVVVCRLIGLVTRVVACAGVALIGGLVVACGLGFDGLRNDVAVVGNGFGHRSPRSASLSPCSSTNCGSPPSDSPSSSSDALDEAGRAVVTLALGQALSAGIGFRFLASLFGGFLVEECLPVGHRDLVIIRVDFVEGEEAVAVAAVVDERRLQRRLNARHLGEIDVAPQEFAGSRFVVELLYTAAAEHHNPGFLGVGGIDKHFAVGHACFAIARRLVLGPIPASGPAVACRRVRARAFSLCVKYGSWCRARAPPGIRSSGWPPTRVLANLQAFERGVRSLSICRFKSLVWPRAAESCVRVVGLVHLTSGRSARRFLAPVPSTPSAGSPLSLGLPSAGVQRSKFDCGYISTLWPSISAHAPRGRTETPTDNGHRSEQAFRPARSGDLRLARVSGQLFGLATVAGSNHPSRTNSTGCDALLYGFAASEAIVIYPNRIRIRVTQPPVTVRALGK